MYKVFLVDDDYYVLEFLDKMIPWESLGFEVIGLYKDGLEAISSLKENTPDVIITDIGMPGLDGINLIRKVKEKKEDIYSIFLTCHDEFSFVQQALKLNSFDYILKETMDIENITEILVHLKRKIDKERETQIKINNLDKLRKVENTILLCFASKKFRRLQRKV